MDAYRVAYDGGPYAGFQRQPAVETVEGALFDALRSLDVFDGAAPEAYSAAGRTDAGVSALAQTVAFEAPTWLSPDALNGRLPDTIRVWARAPASASFHAARDASWRQYTYFLYAPTLDIDDVRGPLARFEGTHDFHNLTPDDARTERTIEATAVADEETVVVLRIRGDAFCRHQIRRMVTAVRLVAEGEREPAWIDRLLGPTPIDGPAGVGPAPARPLVLSRVQYPNLSFDADSATRARVAATFAERIGVLEARRRVAEHLRAGLADGLPDDP